MYLPTTGFYEALLMILVLIVIFIGTTVGSDWVYERTGNQFLSRLIYWGGIVLMIGVWAVGTALFL